MDMDPITRREALKIERVLEDLREDLELLSYLPSDFELWLRDDAIIRVQRSEGLIFPETLDSTFSETQIEERQKMLKAHAFLQAASQFGDPADSEGNEAVIQTAEFSQLESHILDTATHVGTVSAEELEFHRLSVRALIDTLREGGYGEGILQYLIHYFPPRTPSATSRSSSMSSQANDSVASAKELEMHQVEKAAPYELEEACDAAIVDTSLSHVKHIFQLLHRIIQLRNMSTVNEDVHRYKVLHEAVNKEQSATADVQALNREYEEVKASRKREVAHLDDEIRKLEEELSYVQRAADVELDAFHEVSAKIQSDHRQAFQEQLEVHRQAADVAKERMKQVQIQHAEATNQLRSLRAKKEAAVSGAIQEYESQMANLHAAMEKLQEEYEKDMTKVLELEKKLGKLHTSKKNYEIELQVKERREDHGRQIREQMEVNAKVLQAYFRAYMVRVNFEKELNKKKKKKRKKA